MTRISCGKFSQCNRLYLPTISQLRELSCFREMCNKPSRSELQNGFESPSERMTEHREKYILLLRVVSREMKVRFFGVSVIGE